MCVIVQGGPGSLKVKLKLLQLYNLKMKDICNVIIISDSRQKMLICLFWIIQETEYATAG